MKKKLKQIIKKALTFILLSVLVLTSCDDESASGFNADFSYVFTDKNHIEYTNESTGEYHSLRWDFGIGETVSSEDKNKTFEVYYPHAGDYNVILTTFDYSGNKKEATKVVSIEDSDLVVSFTATVDTDEQNYVVLENTTTGTYETIKWLYRSKEVENEQTYMAYFPKAGSYNVELQVIKNGAVFSAIKNVVINQDDPNYIENMTLVWSDEFNNEEVNLSDWTFETGATGWGNNELQNYTSGENAEIVDGKLVITARKINDDKVTGSYTSSRLITKGKQEFKYGRYEIRAKLPSGTGIWPAIWMLGGNINTVGWPTCGETDIMEYVGYQPNTIHSTVHTKAGYGVNGDGSSKILTSCEEEFHKYVLIWDEKQMIFYTDTPDNVTHVYSPVDKTEENWPFDQTQFFILNVAVGGNWGGVQGIDNSIFPQSMEIDYIRVYQESSKK